MIRDESNYREQVPRERKMKDTQNRRQRHLNFRGKQCPIFYLNKERRFGFQRSLTGIYVLVCLRSGSAYVGSTKDIQKRANSHIRQLRQSKHSNPNLSRCYDKNSDQWACIVLDLMPDANEIDLLTREMTYIDNPLFDLNVQRSEGLDKVLKRKTSTMIKDDRRVLDSARG